MNINYLQEAFTELDCLNEDTFKATVDGIEELDDFMSNDEIDDTIQIIDPEAETEEDVKENYEGNVILECPACKSKLYKEPEEIVVDEETETCNIGEECPYCYTSKGFKILGQVAPFSVKDIEVTAEKTDEEDGEEVKETEKEEDEEELKESFNNASIQLDNNKITIESTEEKVDGAEMIEPLSADLKSDLSIGEDGEVEPSEELLGDEDFEEEDVDIDDFDEESFDEMAESYLKENFSDIRSYKTRTVKEKNNKLIAEGVIRFNDGTRKTTKFNLTPNTIYGKNNLKFICENVNLPKRNRKFMIEGRYRKFGKKFITEKYSAR